MKNFFKNYLFFWFYIKMWKSKSSLVRFTKKQVDSAKKAISKYAGQVINLVPEPIRRTVNTVTGNLITKINEIFENKKKLPTNAVEESSPQQEVVTNKTEIKSTPNETGESSTPQEVITNKTEIKLVENGGRAKVFKTTGNLNFDSKTSFEKNCFSAWASTLNMGFNLPGHSHEHMEICGIYLHLGNNETRKRKEQRLIFKLGTLAPNGINERFSFA